ncbi:MYG1 family protein [Malonomonas rubra]|uniref:MYG1 family protein n=1 Tax=Malonomonas rubra TaxID=57040 RepID=UPI0026EF4FC4|nr:MYG1 family protein [Malonomonas rubra]
MYKIVVHPGSAHKDDFLSVSVLLASLDRVEAVYRREATPEDLADRFTYVVDVGMDYNEQLHNFDHHQDSLLPCAFHLVMKHLGHHERATLMFEWYGYMSMIDVRGPYRTAEHLGIDTGVLFAASSPIDGYILSRFSKLDELKRGDLFYALMKEFGLDLLAMIERKYKRLERLKAEAQVVPVRHLKAIVSTIAEDPKLSMDRYIRYLNDKLVAMSITPSARGEGWEMLRLGDNSSVDFRAVADNPEIRFVHANGFVAKTQTLLPLEEAVQLATQAVTPLESFWLP